MNNWLLLLVGFPIGIAVVWFLVRDKAAGEIVATPRWKNKPGPVKVTRNKPRHHEQHFYGAYVQVGINACEAAKAIADHRFLADEAPHFPLPDCDRDECRCMLRPQDDRRAGYDRRGDSFSAYGNFEMDRHAQKRDHNRDRRHRS